MQYKNSKTKFGYFQIVFYGTLHIHALIKTPLNAVAPAKRARKQNACSICFGQNPPDSLFFKKQTLDNLPQTMTNDK